jgi:SAM-dependent methyltransferase
MSPGNKSSYREYFRDTATALEYERKRYNSGSYGDVLWQVEQSQLSALLGEFRRSHRTVDYLDFAAGSGRITSFMETLVDSATGIEISESMAELARGKVQHSKIICCDITSPDTPIEGTYDLITAFRFVLNAEPSLQLAALKALARRLRDSTSWLIFNNHNYIWSHKLMAYPVDAVRGLGRGHKTSGNYLAHRQVFRLADAAGLRIDRIIGCGLFSGKVTRMLTFGRAVALERMAASNSFLSRFGVNQMYVARLKAK